MPDKLGSPHKAALLALMAVGREVSNPELKTIVGFTITGEVRTRLESEGLISSRQDGRSFRNALTEKGWNWCTQEQPADLPPRSGRLGAACYAILDELRGYLRRRNLQLEDVFQSDAAISTNGLESHIRGAYRKLAREPREWVRLADLRAELRDDVDEVLRQMRRDKLVYLEPDENRKMLTEADHAAAIRIGLDDNHLIAIEKP